MGSITLRPAKIVCLNLTIGCTALHVIAILQRGLRENISYQAEALLHFFPIVTPSFSIQNFQRQRC
jgi:hypothetical protein